MVDHRPRAVLVSPVMPAPTGSGRQSRAWNWLIELARDYDVCLVVGSEPQPLPVDFEPSSVVFLGRPSVSRRGLRLLGMALPFLGLKWQNTLLDWYRPERPVPVTGLCDAEGVKAIARIVVFRLYMQDIGLQLAAACPCARLELDLDDLESGTRWSIAACLLRLGDLPGALRAALSGLQYFFVERAAVGRFDQLFLAAAEDAWRLPAAGEHKISHRPNRVTFRSASPRSGDTCVFEFLFVGSLGYPPNTEAARFLAELVVPILRRKLLRPWRLRIVGGGASEALRNALSSVPNVQFLGRVEDLDPIYRSTDVVLVPVRAGGGTKIKTLEAMSYGKPVISTDHGVRGLGAVAGMHYLHATTAAEFAAAAARLAESGDAAAALGEAGRQLCRERFTFDTEPAN